MNYDNQKFQVLFIGKKSQSSSEIYKFDFHQGIQQCARYFKESKIYYEIASINIF